jgi:hypothetical protein
MTAYHNWTHRPRSRGGTDPLENGGHGPWIELEQVNGFVADPPVMYRHAAGSPDDGWELEWRGHTIGPSGTFCGTLPEEDRPPIVNSDSTDDKYGEMAGEDTDTGDPMNVLYYIEASTGNVYIDYPIGATGTGGAVAAEDVSITDSGAYFTATDVEAALQELGAAVGAAGATTYRKTTSKSVNNTVTETDLLNSQITIGANVMGSTGMVRLTAWGTLKNNSGASRSMPRMRFKLGSTTIGDSGTPGTIWDNNGSTWAWRFVGYVMNLGATNSQSSYFLFETNFAANAASGSGMTDGTGIRFNPAASGGASFFRAEATDTAAEDTTSSKAMQLTAELPVANSNLDITLTAALVEVL